MCWESNLDPLEENLTMNSTTELFIQVLLCFFSNSFIYQRLCHLTITGYTLKQQIIFLSGDLPLSVWKPFMEKCYRLRSDPQRQIVDQAWQSWEDRPIPFRIPGSHLFFQMIYFVTVISTVTPEKWVPTWNSRHRVANCLFCLLRLEGGCSYDYILLFDGPEYNSSLIARVCNGASGTFTSTRNFMSVVFITDVSVTLRGFQANYIAVYVPSTSEFHCENECTLVFGGAFWSSIFQSLWHKQYHGLPGSYACLLWRGTVCSLSGGSDWQKDGWGTALADGRNTGFSVIIRK